MKKFIVNVNGNSYEVEVEEIGGSVAAAPAPASAPAAPVAEAPKAAPAAAAAPKAQGSAGSVKITAPMPGNILNVKVKPGDAVKKGDLLLILEAMKMENEIVAAQDGTIATVNVAKGHQVNSGDVLVTMG